MMGNAAKHLEVAKHKIQLRLSVSLASRALTDSRLDSLKLSLVANIDDTAKSVKTYIRIQSHCSSEREKLEGHAFFLQKEKGSVRRAQSSKKTKPISLNSKVLDYINRLRNGGRDPFSLFPEDTFDEPTRERILNAVSQIGANPYFVKKTIKLLENAKLYTDKNCRLVMESARNNKFFLTVLCQLDEAELLTQENFTRVVNNSPHTNTLPSILSSLTQAKLLTNDVFTKLLDSRHAFLYSKEAKMLVWDQMPDDLFTEETLDNIFSYAAEKSPKENLTKYISGLKSDRNLEKVSVPFCAASLNTIPADSLTHHI